MESRIFCTGYQSTCSKDISHRVHLLSFTGYHTLNSILLCSWHFLFLGIILSRGGFFAGWLHPIQLQPRLALGGLLTRGLELGRGRRMVDFDHQFVDQCSQQSSDTRSHYRNPPPASSSPAKTDGPQSTRVSIVAQSFGATELKLVKGSTMEAKK